MGQRRRTTRRKKTPEQQIRKYIKFGIIVLVLVTIGTGILRIVRPDMFYSDEYTELSDKEITADKPDIDVQLLDVNEYSRPGKSSDRINGIVIHYTANPGSTAQQNRNYFEGLKDSHETKTSSHFVIGIAGEVIQCVPTWEIAYASNKRNADTVSIECCHPDADGKFSKGTYRSAVQLTAWLCQKFGLTEKDVIRHYDITGKNCPKYYVENEADWKQFKKDVGTALKKAS